MDWATLCLCSVAQSRLTVTPWTVCSPPGSSVHGIFQARILEQVAISSSRGSSRLSDQTQRIHLPVQEMQEMQVRFLGWEDSPEEEMAAHTSILA